ncbi:MAG: hypothetical protein V4580_11285 [Bacteroidota bacterium]
MTTSRVSLNNAEIQEYLVDHLPYRLNSLRAWDLYLARRKADRYENETPSLKCYWESELLEPAYEISIVFGRSLLNFLGIKRGSNGLENFESNQISNMDKDTIFIWHINSNKRAYPINNLDNKEQEHLVNLLKVANKSVAHLTNKTSTKIELDSLIPARQIIYKIMLEYVDGLKTSKLWWFPRKP